MDPRDLYISLSLRVIHYRHMPKCGQGGRRERWRKAKKKKKWKIDSKYMQQKWRKRGRKGRREEGDSVTHSKSGRVSKRVKGVTRNYGATEGQTGREGRRT